MNSNIGRYFLGTGILRLHYGAKATKIDGSGGRAVSPAQL
jgi:hypothetical protein